MTTCIPIIAICSTSRTGKAIEYFPRGVPVIRPHPSPIGTLTTSLGLVNFPNLEVQHQPMNTKGERERGALEPQKTIPYDFANYLKVESASHGNKLGRHYYAKERPCPNASRLYRSTSPNTRSIVPMTATASGRKWCRIIKSAPARWAKPGARILQRYGRLEPSETR